MDLGPALQAFYEETSELLEQLEENLLELESDPGDRELINLAFAAAHTIKGSAGLFDFQAIVGFTHVVESVLMTVRDSEVRLDNKAVGLLLNCVDHLGSLVEVAEDAFENLDPALMGRNDELVNKLISLGIELKGGDPSVAVNETSEAIELADGELNSAVLELDEEELGPEGSSESDYWHLSLRFPTSILCDCMDPMSFIRYLNGLGEIKHMSTVSDLLPALDQMDPELCYLGFEIALDTIASKQEIEGTFDLINDEASITILPPRSKIAEYLKLIRNLPEDVTLLGEILIQCGALTQDELNKALLFQSESGAEGLRIGEVLQEVAGVSKDIIETGLEKQKESRREVSVKRKIDSSSMRIEASKLDELINQVGELVICSATTSLLSEDSSPKMRESVDALSNLVDSVRDSCLSMRMIAIRQTFTRFQRVVRDISSDLGKDIILKTIGEETELDKSMVEKLNDPLLHLVRNAIDHGIEMPEDRVAKGKPAQGVVTLSARHESGSIVIEIKDDGAGLDTEKIVAKAKSNGLIKSAEGMTKQDILLLILEPGFSTAAEVTELSGRGVGMDVVKRNIERLNGSIEVNSEFGKGSHIRLRLPLTLAIIDGFLMKLGGEKYAVPLNSVQECIEIESDASFHEDSGTLKLRGEILPLIDLRKIFNDSSEKPSHRNIVVVDSGGLRAGIVIDYPLGAFQAVIKPLSEIFKKTTWLSGTTILGSGEVSAILDIPGLVGLARNNEQHILGSTQH